MPDFHKRSVLTKDRLKVLSQPNIVYVITCYHKDYYCEGHSDGHCWRGFFSLYLQVAYGIFFAKNQGIPYTVDFGNLDYFCSNGSHFSGDRNFWQYYFETSGRDNSLSDIINLKHENYPLRIWSKNFLKKIQCAISSEIKLKNEISDCIQNVKRQFEGNRILGIHIRKTDHFREVAPAKLDTYLKLVNKRKKVYDKLFIATDDKDILQVFKNIYKNKVIHHPFLRSSGSIPLHGVQNKAIGYLLGKEALIDCHSLALCDELILSPSNLSYCALVINPDIPFSIAESWEAKKARYKTLVAYYLNEWGLRKW